MSFSPKTPRNSFSQMTELVLPNDTNILGKLLGGRLLHFMDVVAAMAAMRHSNRICVTASVDSVDFKSSVQLGEIIILEAWVTRAFNSSMEVRIDVHAEDLQTADRRKTNSAYYTFVAVDQAGRPIPVHPIQPETDLEKQEFEAALGRREIRLMLAGKLKPEDAKHTHGFFAPRKPDGK